MNIIGEADIEDILDEGGIVIVSAADVDGFLPAGVTVSGDTIGNIFSERWENTWRLASGSADLSALTGDVIDISNADVGTVQIGLISTDGYTISSEFLHNVEVSSANTNTPPVSTDPYDQNLAAGEAFSITFALSDIDDDAITYELVEVTSSGIALNESRVNDDVIVTGTAPTNPIASTITLRLTPNDGTEDGTPVTVNLNISAEVIIPPVEITPISVPPSRRLMVGN